MVDTLPITNEGSKIEMILDQNEITELEELNKEYDEIMVRLINGREFDSRRLDNLTITLANAVSRLLHTVKFYKNQTLIRR